MPGRKKRVLVVDDEEDLTWSISKHLEKDKDRYDLLCVNSGQKALDLMAQLPVDLVVSDIKMPEITGLELLEKIKQDYPAAKVIIMTAFGSSEVKEEANRLGCLRYIEKPFEISELRQWINDALQDKKGFAGKISDFQLTDLIQLNCYGRMSSALKITHDEEEGIIYFKDGNIVHAEAGKLEGEDAVYDLLAWNGGTFSSEKDLQPPKETVFKGWQGLLIEGMRRLDEIKRRESGAIDQEKKNQKYKINTILKKFVDINGVLFASIFDHNGFLIASTLSESMQENNVSELVTKISNLINQIEQNTKIFEFKSMRNIKIELENGLIQINRISGKEEFLIILSSELNTIAKINLEVRKNLKDLAKLV